MNRRPIPKIGSFIVLVLALIGLSVGLGSADTDLEDPKLEAFVEAASAVDSVIAAWQPKIVRAEDERQAARLRDKANAEIRKSIDDVDGISFVEYREIRQAMALDPEMRSKVTKIMRRQSGR